MRFQRLITLLILILPACQSSAAVAGTAGIGDPLFTNLGNGGYDVQRYDLVLDVDPEANRLRARVVIDAVALEQLKQFNLDFENLTIETVEVNGKPAEFARSGGELTITPPRPLTKGWNFSVRIVYNGEPQPLKPITSAGIIPPPGWHHAQSGAINVMSEPNGAAGWFPLNNHPRDKALYRINIGVPAPWVAVAPGVLKETRAEGASIRYIWEMQRPMAGYLASVNIGRYQDDVAAGPHDVLIRSYFPSVLNLDAQLQTAKIPDMLVYFESVFGRYPFLQYGVLQADENIPPCHSIVGGAMEVQTIPVICPEGIAREAVMAHELAHQWFGNSVSLKNWQDLWLKEGAATYAEWLWDYRDKNLSDLNAYVADVLDGYTPEGITGAPTADNLYGYYTYIGGALVFHALRLQIGDERFFHLLREYLNRYQYANAGTRDFTDLAEEISGQDLTAFFNAWLYNKPPRQLPSP